jgi:beta-glucosidase/6-phospho-beta-glucosidase/beta-galactosidase
VQDDAWLQNGPGTLDSRLVELDRMGVDVVRYTVRWDDVAGTRPATPRDPRDPAYDWRKTDAVLRGLRRHGIEVVLTLYGTPSWANGGLSANWAPTSSQAFGDFARAAATRYSWVRLWAIWNEPNRPQWLRPTAARTYVERLLNPAYDRSIP